MTPSLANRLKYAPRFSVWVLDPIRRPDAMDTPAESLENLLSEPVTVTCRLRRVVGSSVALHPEQVTIRLLVLDPEVDAEPADSHLWDDVQTMEQESVEHRFLKRRLRLPALARDFTQERDRPLLREFEVSPQEVDALRLCTAKVDRVCSEGGQDLHLITGASLLRSGAARPRPD